MTLATADADGVPWANPVEFACDEGLRFYWNSLPDARHSRNVRSNPRAALVIYDSTQAAGVRAEVQGLYVEGPVEEFERSDLHDVLPSLERWIERRGPARTAPEPRATDEVFEDAARWRIYRLTPERWFALDPNGHPDLPGVRVWRVPVDLAEAFARASRARQG